MERVISDVLAIKANLILKTSPELEFKEAYALAATTSVVTIDKVFGSVGRKELVKRFQKFVTKGRR